MLNDTRSEYFAIRLVIIILSVVGPLCTAYTATLLRRWFVSTKGPSLDFIAKTAWENAQWSNLTLFQWYCVAEACFYLFFLWYRTHLQREAIHPPLWSKEDRRELFEKLVAEIHDPEKFLSGWFRGANVEDIGREDVKGFAGWAFFEGRNTEEDAEELEEITAKMEERMGRTFKPGKGTAKSLKLTLDPIEMETRCLLWYSIIMLVDTVAHIRMLRYGMKYYSTMDSTFKVFPPRPLAEITATAASPAENISYWLRPHTSKIRLPVVFLHGIGVGLHPHIEFLHELDQGLNENAKEDDKVGILTIEVLQISSRLTHSIPTREEFLEQMTQILDRHGYDRFVVCSHSYGSVFTTYMLTNKAMASRVAGTLLLDPVTILLHMPDVAYNFTVRQPRHANEWQLWYFASKDPGVSHTLGRHFFWSQNVLWQDRILELVGKGMRMTVSLASRDLIVDTQAVGAYLAKHEVPDPVIVKDGANGQKHMELGTHEKKKGKDGEVEVEEWKQRTFTGKGLEVLWWDDFDHAQVFDSGETRGKLVDVLVEYSKGG
ncbi:hypothetical protein LTR85_002452 [Meristemomyces frigidus]|nr:hypothetical protein LTR85_002452 [Meristemomyces frigidus]